MKKIICILLATLLLPTTILPMERLHNMDMHNMDMHNMSQTDCSPEKLCYDILGIICQYTHYDTFLTFKLVNKAYKQLADDLDTRQLTILVTGGMLKKETWQKILVFIANTKHPFVLGIDDTAYDTNFIEKFARYSPIDKLFSNFTYNPIQKLTSASKNTRKKIKKLVIFLEHDISGKKMFCFLKKLTSLETVTICAKTSSLNEWNHEEKIRVFKNFISKNKPLPPDAFQYLKDMLHMSKTTKTTQNQHILEAINNRLEKYKGDFLAPTLIACKELFKLDLKNTSVIFLHDLTECSN